MAFWKALSYGYLPASCTPVANGGDLFHLDTNTANSFCAGGANGGGAEITLNGSAAIVSLPAASGNKAFASGNLRTGNIGVGTGQAVNYAGYPGGVMASTSEPFTMEFWVYSLTKSGPDEQIIMGTEIPTTTPQNGDLTIQRATSDSWAIFLYNGSWIAVGGGFNVQNSVWHHVAFMRGTDDIPVVYLDGSAAQWSGANNVALGVVGQGFKLGGGNHSATVDFEGHIADYRFTRGKRLYGGNTVAGQTGYTMPATLLPDTDPNP